MIRIVGSGPLFDMLHESLKGLVKEPSEWTVQIVPYHNLPPGKHTFRIREKQKVVYVYDRKVGYDRQVSSVVSELSSRLFPLQASQRAA